MVLFFKESSWVILSSKREVIADVLIWFLHASAVGVGGRKTWGREGMGSAPPGGRALSCPAAGGLKGQERKHSWEQSKPKLTQSRGRNLPGHRGKNKLTSKKSPSPPSLCPKALLRLFRHQEFSAQRQQANQLWREELAQVCQVAAFRQTSQRQ